MKIQEQINFKNKASFRSWLEKNHNQSPGVCILFYKKHVNIEGIKYSEALEEALCFGWIDSLVKRLDDEQYVRKFTPRKDTSKWSEVNKKKVTALMKEGRMTEAGLKRIDIYLKTERVDWENKTTQERDTGEFDIPEFIMETFAQNEPALTHFNQLAQSYKKHYLDWITKAKREKTIRKRLMESVALLKENKKLGMK